MIEITFVRHAETDANAGLVWQGQSDAPLTELGRRQAADLGRRIADVPFDAVVASDLGRVLETAALAGLDPVPDPAWREVDIGRWEGLTREEVWAGHKDDLEALGRGEDVPLGGGETWREFGLRIDEAVRALSDRFPGGRVLVLGHGGTIHSVVSGVLGFRGRGRSWPVDRVQNTAMTVLVADDRGRRITSFNDSAHTPTTTHPKVTGPRVALIRHAETEANLAGRYQGTGDGPLTPGGVAQAQRLASWYGGIGHLAASPRERARATAAALGAAVGLEPVILEDLGEMDFGGWEDLTPAEIAERFPDEWRAVMVNGRDVPRGVDGETFAGAAARLAAVVEEVGAAHERSALVTHGAVIRAYVAGVVGLGFVDRRRLGLPANASVTQVRLGVSGSSLASYNVVGG